MPLPARGQAHFTGAWSSTGSYKGSWPRKGTARASQLVGVGFEGLWDQTVVGFEGLRQSGDAGDGVQAGRGGQGGGGGALLDCGAYIGSGFEWVSGRGGKVPHTLDSLTELTWGRYCNTAESKRSVTLNRLTTTKKNTRECSKSAYLHQGCAIL